ncbi:short-chain dehydrogenase reductase sdr [Diplodia corticola]|uniref:Short-chain dehydrogenase reductase sdr n=1 Tax=Diplodia corticola TaxID=236234 RepID=A0A1J9RL96_9PEZI|nr:short-chain dehydrogenase reductase sdr [Diplodia corticola]OJD40746.1 short-chain dehydrogenase reductase sdr [Diplodia corticola]
MFSSLAGRTYIVTGGASGIGLATVNKLLGLSATVHVIDRAREPPKITAGAGKVHTYPDIDVSSRQAVADTFKTIVDCTPTISGLVNAAGISPSGNYDMAGEGYAIEKDETYARIMDINAGGTWNATTELLRHTLASKRAEGGMVSIVNIGSLASLRGIRMMAAYCASKHAVLGMTRSWALEYADQGIRVNLIAPGLIRTPLGMKAVGSEDERTKVAQAYADGIPMKRIGEPDDIAGPIVFLLSDEASYMTGEAILVGGGL